MTDDRRRKKSHVRMSLVIIGGMALIAIAVVLERWLFG